MVHAERNLGFRDGRGNLTVDLEPLLGGTRFSAGTVIGWQSGPQKRIRVDFDNDFVAKLMEHLLFWFGTPAARRRIFLS